MSKQFIEFHIKPFHEYLFCSFQKLPFGLTISVFGLPVITMNTEDAPELNDSLNMATFTFNKPNDLYKKRLNGVVEDYIKWGILEPLK